MEDVVVRYMHFIGIIVLAAMLVAEHLLISKQMDLKTFKKLVVLDSVYGLSAMVTLVAGLLLWLAVGKPSEFYSSNFIFHIKVSLFVTIGLLSAVPTTYFIRNRKTTAATMVLPNYIVAIIRLELTLLLLIPLLAVLMARGIGNG